MAPRSTACSSRRQTFGRSGQAARKLVELPSALLLLLAISCGVQSIGLAQAQKAPVIDVAFESDGPKFSGPGEPSSRLTTLSVPCDSPEACLALCPDTDIKQAQPDGSFWDEPTVWAKLGDCINAVRQAPDAFASAFNSICQYSDFQSDVNSPPRGPLNINGTLSGIAQNLVGSMIQNRFFDHTDTQGVGTEQRVKAAVPEALYFAELIAAGWPSIRSVVVQWMCSAPHRAVIMSCAYDTVGWGVEFDGSFNGQNYAMEWPTYFAGEFLCSSPGGCGCPQSAPGSSPSSSTGAQVENFAPDSAPAGPGYNVNFNITYLAKAASNVSAEELTTIQTRLTGALQNAAAPVVVSIRYNAAEQNLGTFTSTVISASLRPGGGGARRRLQQLQDQPTTQAVVYFTAMAEGIAGGQLSDPDLQTLLSQYSTAIQNYLVPIPVGVAIVPDNTPGQQLVLNTAVAFPPDNQLAGPPNYSSDQANAFSSTMQTDSRPIFSALQGVSSIGNLVISNVNVESRPLSAPNTQLPASTESALGPAAAPAPPASDAAGNPLIEGPWLQFNVTVEFPGANGADAMTFAQSLYDRPANALGTIIAEDGPVSIMGLMLMSPVGSTIEAFVPVPGPMAGGPTAIAPTGATAPAAAPVAPANVTGCLYALNMQYSRGKAYSDSPASILAAVFDVNVTAPAGEDFSVSLAANATGGEVSAVVPYVPDTMYLLQVTVPDAYRGEVTVQYGPGGFSPLTFTVQASPAVVKVTATTASVM